MPLRLYDFSTHIRLIPHFAGSGSVLQHHGCELSLGLTGCRLIACYHPVRLLRNEIQLCEYHRAGGKTAYIYRLTFITEWKQRWLQTYWWYFLSNTKAYNPFIVGNVHVYLQIPREKTVDGWSKSKSVICKAWFTKRIHKTMCSSNNEVPSVTNKLQESVVKNFAH